MYLAINLFILIKTTAAVGDNPGKWGSASNLHVKLCSRDYAQYSSYIYVLNPCLWSKYTYSLLLKFSATFYVITFCEHRSSCQALLQYISHVPTL